VCEPLGRFSPNRLAVSRQRRSQASVIRLRQVWAARHEAVDMRRPVLKLSEDEAKKHWANLVR
jgi:hypothetical protein